MPPIYLDHNATTRPADAVISAVSDALANAWANASSVHRAGQEVRYRLELSRETIAGLIGAAPAEIVLTSGGTESTNLAIFGSAKRILKARARSAQASRQSSTQAGSMGHREGEVCHPVIITTPVEHSAVREPIEALESDGWTVITLPIDANGVVEPEDLRTALAEYGDAVGLISIQWANNETGVLQSIVELAAIKKETMPRAVFHTDAIQAVGKLPINVREIEGLDLLSFAGHKFHGPKGVGGLWVRRGVRLSAQQQGGPHERQRRGGTENVPGIIGLAVAAELAMERLASDTAKRVQSMRDDFERQILETIPETSVNGVAARFGRLWNTSNIAFHRLEAEAILLLLSERGLYASAGAACSSGSLDPSPVLLAMGIPAERAHGSIRFSLSPETTQTEMGEALEMVQAVIARLRESLPVVDH